ncbi:hypothetical protein MSG28_000834 [Choristoneura fumiferana]|uniref:Uncharacterized protein n=1 Tax=Choristoneura fumiferana TaxID=7141 RepID=A0ACC0K2C0_CHOFU|nr:hypothetical protein MSG28_000834 [Choristoneura fumiferana]
MVATFVAKNGHVATIVLEGRKTVNADWYTTLCLPEVPNRRGYKALVTNLGYAYDPDSTQQSTVRVFQEEPKPTKVIRSRSTSKKKMVATFVAKNGHVATIVLEGRKTVNADWYTTLCLPEEQKQQQRQASEGVIKKSPWSAVGAQAQQATSQEGPTLAEIQRLEREKKLEQMKEQQQMMQAIAQQQAAALAREHEMQAGLGWAKKKPSTTVPGLTLAEIQAEARQQSAAAAAAVDAAAAAAQAAQALEEVAMTQPNHVPWGNTHNGGGFWDSPSPAQSSKVVDKVQEMPRVAEQSAKIKKKNTLNVPAKKEASPVAEFDIWCNSVLAPWSAKIDGNVNCFNFAFWPQHCLIPFRVDNLALL